VIEHQIKHRKHRQKDERLHPKFGFERSVHKGIIRLGASGSRDAGKLFSWANFKKCTFFDDSCSVSDSLLAGNFLDVGEAGAKGKYFYSTKVEISTFFWMFHIG
jgi:hypothetical protein